MKQKVFKILSVLILVMLVVPGPCALSTAAAQAAAETPSGWYMILLEHEYFYYTDTTWPDTHWRVHWIPVIPNYRNRAIFEAQNLFGEWVPEYTIDLVYTGGCSVETSSLPATCWVDAYSIALVSDGSKLATLLVRPILLPLIFK